MPIDIDRYPSLGPKRRITGPEEALRLVREIYPTAIQEGSMGSERSWTIGSGQDRLLVAHHWNPWRGRNKDIWWIRIATNKESAIPDF